MQGREALEDGLRPALSVRSEGAAPVRADHPGPVGRAAPVLADPERELPGRAVGEDAHAAVPRAALHEVDVDVAPVLVGRHALGGVAVAVDRLPVEGRAALHHLAVPLAADRPDRKLRGRARPAGEAQLARAVLETLPLLEREVLAARALA